MACQKYSGHATLPVTICVSMQLIKGLEEARGNGTSMISLIMPPKDQVSPQRSLDLIQKNFQPGETVFLVGIALAERPVQEETKNAATARIECPISK